MITKREGYNATYRFFKVVCRLRLISKKRADLEVWLLLRKMILRKIND